MENFNKEAVIFDNLVKDNYYTPHMDITVVKQVSVFDGLVLREHVHEEVLHKLINSNLLKEVCSKMVS